MQNPWFWHNANEKCYVVPSENAKVRGQIYTVFTKTLHFTGRKACSKRSTAVIVRHFLCSRDQRLYMTCVVSNYARCFCIRVPGKDIDFVPLGEMFLGLGCTCNTDFFGLGLDGLVTSSNGVLSNMNVLMVCVWMFWYWDNREHESHSCLGRDALVIGCCRT